MGINFPTAPTVGTIYPNPAVAGVPQYTWDGEKWTSGTVSVVGAVRYDTAQGLDAGQQTQGRANIDAASSASTATALAGKVNNSGDVMTGVLRSVPSTGSIAASVGLATFEVTGGATPADAAFMTFHRPGIYASHFGLDIDNNWKVGGFSAAGVAYKLYHEGNLHAAPFDALAYSGIQINGSMEVSQELGTGAASIIGSGLVNLVDGWRVYSSNALGQSAGVQHNLIPHHGFRKSLGVYAGNPPPTHVAGDYVFLNQSIEGYRWSRLAFGWPEASPITISFWIYSNTAGTISVAVRQGLGERSYVTSISVPADTWQYKKITIPGDTTGTWATDNALAATLSFCLVAGPGTLMTPVPDTWQAGNFIAVAAQSYLLPATNVGVYITGVTIMPGNEGPTAERAPLIMRPYDQELVTCKRYLQIAGAGWNGTWVTASAAQLSSSFNEMRIAPTSSLTTPAPIILEPFVASRTGSGSTISLNALTKKGVILGVAGFSGATPKNSAMMEGDFIMLDGRL